MALLIQSFLLILLACTLHGQVIQSSVTSEDLQTMIDLTNNFIKSQPRDPIRKLLRLVFHDCMGGCDGSVNMENRANAGLMNIVNKLTKLHKSNAIFSKISRADLFVLAESVALGKAIKKSNYTTPFDINLPKFAYGRIENSNGPIDDDQEGIFADPRGSWDSIWPPTKEGLKDKISEKQFIVLLSLHGAGYKVQTNSGFSGQFLPQQFRNSVSNQYFEGLYGLQNQNANIFQGKSLGGLFQWAGNSKSGIKKYLNIDMQIYLNFTVNDLGQTPQKYYRQNGNALIDQSLQNSQNAKLSRNAEVGLKYAKDNVLYQKDLLTAFDKLVNVPSGNAAPLKIVGPKVICNNGVKRCIGDLYLSGCGIGASESC